MHWLVIAAQLGDRAALNELLKSTQERLFRHVSYLLPSQADAEDALQDSLLTISRKIRSLREPAWSRAWAFRIATRIVLRRIRRARAAPAFIDIEDVHEVPAPSEGPELLEDERAILRGALELVPPASRLVLHMKDVSGLTHAEIAESLDVSIGTVKSRAAYGLKWLRQHLRAGSPS